MIKDDTFENAFKVVRSMDVNFQRKSLRIRVDICDKNGKPSGVRQEHLFDEKALIERSVSDAEGMVNFEQINFLALKEIRAEEERLKKLDKTLDKRGRDRIRASVKARAISDKAKELGKKQHGIIMEALALLLDLGKELLTK